MIKKEKPVKFAYDKEVDAAYIYLTYPCVDLPPGSHSEINLDFDKMGKLVGIEILGASKALPEDWK